MGSRALIFYLITTVIATITGVVVALIIHPGTPDVRKTNMPKKAVTPGAADMQAGTMDAMLDIVR